MSIAQAIKYRQTKHTQLEYEIGYLEALQSALQATQSTGVPDVVDFVKQCHREHLIPPKVDIVDSYNVIITFDTIPTIRLGASPHIVNILNGYNAGGDTTAGLKYLWQSPSWLCMFPRLQSKTTLDSGFDLASFIPDEEV